MSVLELESSDPSYLRRAAHDPRPETRRAARAELQRLRLALFEDPEQAARNQELRHRCGLSTMFSSDDKVQIIRELVERGAQAFAVNDDGIAPVHPLVREGPVAALATLLALGASLDAVDQRGRTALHHACSDLGPRPDVRADGLPRRRETIAWLLARGLDPRARDAAGRTPLHYAAGDLDAPCCELLLAAGAELEAPSDNGTPLAWAVMLDNLDTMELLLARGAVAAPSLLDRAKAKHQSRMLARLKEHLGIADESKEGPGAALEQLQELARQLGHELATAAVATGDLEYGEEVGNSVDDLRWSAWAGSAKETLDEAYEVLSASTRRALGDRDAVTEALSANFKEGWQAGLDE